MGGIEWAVYVQFLSNVSLLQIMKKMLAVVMWYLFAF